MLLFLGGIAWVCYVFASPFLLVKDLRNAVANNQPTIINKHIDYPLLQEDIKQQLAGVFGRGTVGGFAPNIDMQILNRLAGGGMTERLVQANVTPERLAAALDRHHRTPEDKRKLFLDEISVSSAYASLSDFDVSVKDHRTGYKFKITMARTGLDWKVVGFKMPDELIDYMKNNPRVLIHRR